MSNIVEDARENARLSGGTFEIVNNMDEAFQDADVVYPKSWGVESLFGDPERALAVNKKYTDWICNEERMKLAKPHAIYMHCLPADRGYEVTDAVIDGKQSVVFDEAENRLHTAKAIMALTMGGR